MLRPLTEALTRLFRRSPEPTLDVVKIEAIDNARIHPDDRARLREWLKNPTTVLALSIVEASKPTPTYVRDRDPAINAQRALESLALQRGWNRFRNSLLLVGTSPTEVKNILETYPDQP